MKLIACIILIATTATNAQDNRPLREILDLSEDITALEIFDLPKKQLEGKPSDIFRDNRISGIVAIDEYNGPRTIVSTIAQSFIGLVRSETPLSKVNIVSPGTVIGMVRLNSGESVLVRRSETQIILQFRKAWGALKRSDFPDILGLTVRVIPSKAEQAGADQPATAPALKSEGKDTPQPESKVLPR